MYKNFSKNELKKAEKNLRKHFSCWQSVKIERREGGTMYAEYRISDDSMFLVSPYVKELARVMDAYDALGYDVMWGATADEEGKPALTASFRIAKSYLSTL